jgi:hypothetical protein
MIMVARHEPPSHRRQFHARHGLCDDTVARLDIVKDVARDDDMRSSASHGERTDAVDDVEPCFGKRAAHFGGKPPERPSSCQSAEWINLNLATNRSLFGALSPCLAWVTDFDTHSQYNLKCAVWASFSTPTPRWPFIAEGLHFDMIDLSELTLSSPLSAVPGSILICRQIAALRRLAQHRRRRSPQRSDSRQRRARLQGDG